MDNKIIYIIILVLLVSGGFFLFTRNDSTTENQPSVATRENTTLQNEGTQNEAMENEVMMPEETAEEETVEEAMKEYSDEEAMMEESAVKTFEVGGGGYYFNPEEITVTEGDTVKIVFTNEGGTHDWVIDEFNARTPIIQTGETAEIEFVADEAGSFEYYCSVGNHRALGMVGTLTVEPKQ